MTPLRLHITGSNGFLGRILAEYFRPRYKIDLSGRQSVDERQAGNIAELPYHQIIFDEGNDISPDIFADIDVLIHCAGLAHHSDKICGKEAFYAANVSVSVKLFRAAIKAGVKRFIFISSISVYDTSLMDIYIDNDTACNPTTYYGKSKRAAEQSLQDLAAGSDVELVIIRLPLIIGVQKLGNIPRLIDFVAKGFPIPVPCKDNARSYITPAILCDLIEKICISPQAAGQIFLAANHQPLATRVLIESLQKGMGLSPKTIRLPDKGYYSLMRLINQSDIYVKLFGSLIVDSSKTVAMLDWDNKDNLPDAFYNIGQCVKSADNMI